MDFDTAGQFDAEDSNTLKDYIWLIRNNWLPVLLISIAGLAVAVLYAFYAIDYYSSTTSIKLSRPQGGGILTSPMMPEFVDWGNDRFIANEIEILESYRTREKVALALVDSFYRDPDKRRYYVLIDQELKEQGAGDNLITINQLIRILSSLKIDQKRGLDMVEITASSPSPYEAALIANLYAQQYKQSNLDINRNQLTLIKNFLSEQRVEKSTELNEAEEILRGFQEKGGLIALDERANTLIAILSDFEAQKNATQVDLMASNKILENLRSELTKQNPRMADYLKSLSSQTYIKAIQDEIVKLQINREIAMSKDNSLSENSFLILA